MGTKNCTAWVQLELSEKGDENKAKKRLAEFALSSLFHRSGAARP